MKSSGTSCGTATTVPHNNRVFKGKLRQSTPYTMKVGMKEAAKIAADAWPAPSDAMRHAGSRFMPRHPRCRDHFRRGLSFAAKPGSGVPLAPLGILGVEGVLEVVLKR